ncbi:MAG: cytochrome c biogenesis protein CcsA [Saprospiraceae bacterium]
MEEIQYIGEVLWPRELGHFAILFGFVSSLLATAAYFFATQRRGLPEFSSWRNIGRGAFILHGLSVLAVIGSILFILIEKRYEYAYAQKVVSDALPFKYIFSAFWQEQEGSFLLWMFWHIVLGSILMKTARNWEPPVLAVLSLIQAFILSMLLGIYISAETKIGSNPLLLLRDVMDIPLFNNADYVSLLSGNGLNPLLQNYWMTIHPPTLFLGFASTSVPFAFAIAGLWTGQHKEWLKPALPWALFSGAILGTGILMGGAWAYEALSFGGYWAWDPVENMSLVPWITLVAGIHTHLVARSTGYSYKSTYLFYLLSFILVLYSTFLTRSGVLGESSVHAFTEMGLEAQLILFMGAFFLLGGSLFLWRNKGIPAPQQEEDFASKEFWMFIGSLVLLFSAVIITASTSLPVVNKIVQAFNPDFQGYVIHDAVAHYNKYQLWIGVFIGLLTGAAQFLRYKEFNWQGNVRSFVKHTAISSSLAVLLTIATSFWIQLGGWQFWLLTFCGFFTVVANADYVVSFLKNNLKVAGSAFSHIGFGLMIIGIIASGLNKQHISSNPMVQRSLLDESMLEKNVLLFKNTPMYMSGYRVTYENDTIEGNLRTFVVNYQKLDDQGNVQEEFSVKPAAVYDNKVTKVVAYNPSTKRYLGKDIFTHIATLPEKEADFEKAREREEELVYQTYYFKLNEPLVIRDTVETTAGQPAILETEAVVKSINRNPSNPDYQPEEGDLAIGATLEFRKKDTVFQAEPMVYLRGQLWGSFPVQLNDLSFKVRLNDEILVKMMEAETKLEYKKFTFKQGDEINLNGLTIRFAGVNKNPPAASFKKQEGDVAVAAQFDVSKEGEKLGTAEPVFLIRQGGFLTPKAELPAANLHFYLTKINPDTETFEVQIAQGKTDAFDTIPVQIAKQSYRTDYIVLEAIVFPGINLFWAGSLLMMTGLAVSMFRRMKAKA